MRVAVVAAAAALAAAGCIGEAGRTSPPAPDQPAGQARESSQPQGDPKRGEELFGRLGCIGCHTIDGVGGQVGPNLTGISRRDLPRERPGRTWPDVAAYIRESIRNPQAYVVPGFPDPSPMPSAEMFGLSGQDIEDLLAYLLSVGEK